MILSFAPMCLRRTTPLPWSRTMETGMPGPRARADRAKPRDCGRHRHARRGRRGKSPRARLRRKRAPRRGSVSRVSPMRDSISLPQDGELERLLVKRATLCWLALVGAEGVRAGEIHRNLSIESGDFWDRHVGRSRRDSLRVCRTLATARKLRLPSMQLDIGHNPINSAP